MRHDLSVGEILRGRCSALPVSAHSIRLGNSHENQYALDASIWFDYFFECVLAVSGTATDWENDPALVWWIGCRVDHLHVVFPNGFALGVHVLPLGDSVFSTVQPSAVIP